MYHIFVTKEFDRWLSELSDHRGKARIIARIRSAEMGNLGDAKFLGDGVSEMRIHYGPGYRVYFRRKGNTLILLHCGGDKSSQSRDVKKAKLLFNKYDEGILNEKIKKI